MSSCAARAAILSVTLLGTVAGCASGRVTNLYVLSPAAAERMATPVAGSMGHLQVAPVQLPDFLDSTDILVRRGAGELVPSATGRWGERLSTGIQDALQADLRGRLPAGTLVDARERDPLARRLEVSIAAFDVWADAHVVLVARWTLRGAAVGGNAVVREVTLPIAAAADGKPAGDAPIVAAMTAAVAALADRIVLSADNQSSLDAAVPQR